MNKKNSLQSITLRKMRKSDKNTAKIMTNYRTLHQSPSRLLKSK